MSKKTSEVRQKKSPTDIALETTAFLSSAVPWIGGPVSNVLSGLSVDRKISRVSEVLRGIAGDLRDFKSEVSEEYVKTEDFEELLEETLSRVTRERNEEKRRIYKDFLVDAIKSPGESSNEQIRFLRTLEEMQPDHIRIIRALLKEPDREPGMMGSPIQTLSERLPEIHKERIQDLINHLNDMRVTDLKSLHTMMTWHGAQNLQGSLTSYGRRFIRFLS
jgi:hypothetical protein